MSTDDATSPVPAGIAAILRRARNAKASKERHDTACFAWEASVRLAVAAAPPADAGALALASLGRWVAAARLSSAGIEDAALLAALALFSQEGLGRRAAPRSVSPRRLLDALPPYRNALIGHGAPRAEEFYGPAAETLLAGLEAAWARGAFRPEGAGPLEAAASLAPWVLVREGDLGPQTLFFNGRARTTQYLDYVSGEHLRGEALAAAFPGLEEELVRVFGAPRRRGPGAGTGTGGGEDAPDPDAEPAEDGAERVGGYRVLSLLGEGGMGVVHLAVQETLGRRVALKRMRPGPLGDDVQRARFRREVAALARVDHPHVVKILSSGESRGAPYYAMELVEGADLAKAAAALAPLGAVERARRLAALARDAARGLHALHEAGIVHRDVKPQNIMVTRAEGRAVVMDLGLASVADASRSLTREAGGIAGTLRYVAPERLERGDRAADRRADVYALGATLYELLAGRPAFEGESEAVLLSRILHAAPTPLANVAPGVPRDLAVIVEKALAREPARRYDSAEALARDLEALLEGRPISARPPTLRYVLGLAVRRNRALAATAAALVLALAASPLVVAAARDRAVAEARARLVASAREDAARAARRLEEARAEDAPATEEARRSRADRLLALGLDALSSAERAATLAPEDALASRARHAAARALGEVARDAQQWSVADSAFREALDTGIDDAGSRAALASVEQARTRVAREHREAVERILDDARAGRLDAAPGAGEDAVFRVVALPEAQTVALLGAALDEVAAALRAAAREKRLEAASPTADEAAAGLGPIEGLAAALDRAAAVTYGAAPAPADASRIAAAEARLAARARQSMVFESRATAATGLEVVATAQTTRLGTGGVRLAMLATEALGRIGIAEGAVAPLLRALHAEEDPARSGRIAVALQRLGDGDALRLVVRRLAHFPRGVYRTTVTRALSATEEGRALLWPAAKNGEAADAVAALRAGDDERAEATYSRALAEHPDEPELLVGRAIARLRHGDDEGALEDVERALERAPRSVSALTQRASIRARRREFAVAIQDASAAIEIDPAAVDALVERAGARRATRDFDGALADAGRALAVDPDSAAALRVRGLVRSDRGEADAALADLDRAVSLSPGSYVMFAARGLARQRRGDRDGAIADHTRAIELAPRSVSAVLGRAQAYMVMGRLAEARADYDRAVALDPTDVHPWEGRASCRVRQGDLAGALEDATRGLEVLPTHAVSYRTRGVALVRLGRLDEAIADLQRSTLLDPGALASWQSLATMLSKAGRREEALAAVDRALALDPRYLHGRLTRSLILEKLGRLDESLAEAERAVALEPRAAEAHGRRASILLEHRRFDDAIAEAEVALSLNPRNDSAVESIGLAREGKGDLAGALAAWTRALELDPSGPEYWNNRADVRRKLGDAAGALEDVARSLRESASYGPTYDTRGELALDRGDTAAAIADFERCMALDPGHGAALLHRGLARAKAGDAPGARADLERFLALPRADPQEAARAREALAGLGEEGR